jgi:hypothetical protein
MLSLSMDTRNNIRYIEQAFKSHTEIDASRANILMKKLVDIIAGYDAQVNLINSTHSQT